MVMPPIQVVKGDVPRFDADAIVNAANISMRGGSGVDGRYASVVRIPRNTNPMKGQFSLSAAIDAGSP